MVTIDSAVAKVSNSLELTRPDIALSVAFRVLRVTCVTLSAMALGLLGLIILLPGGALVAEVVLGVGYLFLCGLTIGFWAPKLWMLAGLVAWGGIILAALSLAGKPTDAVMPMFFLAISLGPAFCGGYLGGRARKSRPGLSR